MIFTVTLNPAIDKSVTVSNFEVDAVNRVTSMRIDAGGKGVNVSKVLKELGGASVATGFVGGAAGETLLRALRQMEIPCEFIEVKGSTRTNLKVVDPAKRTYTDINEPGPAVGEAEAEQLLEYLMKAANPGDTVVFAGSSPVGIGDALPMQWARELKSRGIRVVADLDGERLSHMVAGKPFLIKPNAQELQELLGLSDTTAGTLAQAASQLVGEGISHVVVSMGKDGALFASSESVLFARGPKIEAVSTVGAGDTLLGALLFAFEQKMSREEAARFAVAAATAKVMCPGSSPPAYEEVCKYIGQIEITALAQE